MDIPVIGVSNVPVSINGQEGISQHTITHTIQVPAHLLEMLVTGPDNSDSSGHGAITDDAMDLQPSLNTSNSEIVVVSHDMNSHHHNIENGQDDQQQIVTVSVPLAGGSDTPKFLADSSDLKKVSLEESVTKLEHSDESNGQNKGHDLRPRRKAAQPKKPSFESETTMKDSIDDNDSHPEDIEVNIVEEEIVTTADTGGQASEVSDSEDDDDVEEEDDDDEDSSEIRKCVVCLRQRKFTEDIYDAQKQILYNVEALLAHINIPVKKTLKSKGTINCGICPECSDYLQRWHIFHCAIMKRHETVNELAGDKVLNEPIQYESFEARVYRNYKKMGKVKEVFLSATHAHFARRHLTEKDWDFFCDHLFHSNSVKSEKSRELERFLISREKLSQLYCIKCEKLIPNGKKGYTKHVQTEHNDIPVLYPCDICGNQFPEKDMTASTEDYYPHWISHFYFNKCDDCGKRFPTKRALGQHRHAVHKNRQVKCEKCGKVLANKMSLDLHLLRHLPENEKKKYMIKCKVCKKKIAQWNLKSHMATHNEERPWKCDHCEATFKMKGALVSHRDVVHFNLKNHVCSICNEAFKSASSLRGHVRRHEGRKDYKCDDCNKEYYTYSALKGHRVVHQTTREFICEVCGKAFKKKKALDEHSTIHTGEKRHQCPICGREVRVKSNLYKHMKIHKKNPSDSTNSSARRRAANVNGAPVPTSHHTLINTSDTINSNNMNVVSTSGGNNESMSSGSGVEMTEQSLMNNNSNAVQNSSIMQAEATFLTPQFENQNNQTTTALVHEISMQHQHQDLLSVPVQGGHFYNTAPQYFGALEN